MYWPDLWGIWGSPPKTQSEAEVAADRSTRHRTRTISIVETTTIASSWRQLKQQSSKEVQQTIAETQQNKQNNNAIRRKRNCHHVEGFGSNRL